MNVTVKEVAREVGVSPSTVSRAFSGSHPVAEQTRQKIFEAAEELGYAPHLLARALVQRQSPIIGITVLELANPFFAPIIDAIQAEARANNYMLITSQSDRDKDLERLSLNRFRQFRVAGVLVTPVSTNLEHLRRLREQGIAVVVVARAWEEGNYVCVDDFAGGHIVGEHFTGLGHRYFGMVALREPENSALQSRILGFRSAVSESGNRLPQWAVIGTDTLRIDHGKQAADEFLELRDRPTAVFVTADSLAIGFVHRLRERGVRVPEDVAVVGFDDIQYAEFLEVPLTTVSLPKWEMGHKAAQILFAAINSGAAASDLQQIMLRPKLVVRESCGFKLV